MLLQDPLTSEQFVAKRINQRFAKPQNRIKFHNLQATEIRHKNSYVNNPLHKNYLILTKLLGKSNEKSFHKQFLLGMGLNFTVTTHTETVHGNKQFAIYQFILIPDAQHSEYIKIIAKNG